MLVSVRLFLLPLLAVFLVVTSSSCDSKRVFEENMAIGNATWSSSNKAKFIVEVRDINLTFNYYINVRNTGDYQYSNLYLFLQTQFPDG